MKTMKILSVLFVATLLITSCTKFDEGRSVMMVKSKLARTWELTKFEINGNNQDLSNFSLEITFTKEGTYTSKITVPILGTATENGVWEFGDVKSKIRMKEDGETEWDDYTTILSLSSKEMIGQVIEDGVTYRYTYTAK
jgi:hypothetical protein